MGSSALGGFYIPNMSGIWDWNYFWQVVKNFLASLSPFSLIVGASILVGAVLVFVVRGLRDGR